jgi:peptidoglycan-associated lipoprotein
MNTNTSLAIMVVASLAISACASTPKATTTSTPSQEVAANDAKDSATSALPATDVKAASLAGQLREMQKRSIYFDLDEFAIKPEYREIIVQQAELMKKNEGVIVTLEGHADERGSSEYNLALGSKRANSVRKSLEMAGVSGSRIKTNSLGEERPKLTCHEEQCWKENRRVDFVGKQD